MDADAVELRVLGCLIEKQRTTPDTYPLSLNALRLACNQSTNRDPVVDYDEPTIRAALERLGRKGWTRLASGPGSRAVKYRHLLEEALSLTPSQLSVLAVLLLRGAQTPGELKTRTERLYPFGLLDHVLEALSELADRGLVVRLPRRPGQKEDRYGQLLGSEDDTAPAPEEHAPRNREPSLPDADRAAMAALEARLERVEARLDELLDALGTGEPGS